jgi:hypothetical protein
MDQTLFPTFLPPLTWPETPAAGFSKPAAGVLLFNRCGKAPEKGYAASISSTAAYPFSGYLKEKQ